MFDKLANKTAHLAGRSGTFIMAGSLILVWAVSGPLFGFSDTWQLVINTSTTIITFLMVFVIQNTQNRDTEALQLKLDELLRIHGLADNSLMALEELDEERLLKIRREYMRLAETARSNKRSSLGRVSKDPQSKPRRRKA